MSPSASVPSEVADDGVSDDSRLARSAVCQRETRSIGLTADEPHEVLQWLTRESDAGNRGWYVLIENRLTFERPTPTGSIRREGSALTGR